MQGPPLSFADVALVPFVVADVNERYVAWLNDPAVMELTEADQYDHTIETARSYVAQQNDLGSVLFWRIMSGGEHVGNLRASGLGGVHGRAAVALIVGERSKHGKGIGSTAVRLAAEHLLQNGVRKVTAGIYANNVASRKAFERAGFHTEAVLKDHYVHLGKTIDGILVARFQTPV